MIDVTLPTTAASLARAFGASLWGDPDREVSHLSPLHSAGKGSLAFFANSRYSESLKRVKEAVVLTNTNLLEGKTELPLTFILVSDPQRAFAEVARGFASLSRPEGISPSATIHPTVQLGEGVSIGGHVFIGAGSSIGAGTTIYPGAYVGENVEVGAQGEIHPNVVLWDKVRIGARVKIFAGSVIGSEGFGFLTGEEGHTEMPQVGTVVVEDDVRIGAKCTVDRATLGETRVGKGTKLDDQVHIAHNCQIGQNVILCAQVGLAGSVIIEDNAILGGQVGVTHGVTIGRGVRLAGQAGVTGSLPAGETYFLTPAVPMKEGRRLHGYFRRLPEIWKRLKKVEEHLWGRSGPGDIE